jgi:hypothetical protein
MSTIFRIVYAGAIVVVSVLALVTAVMYVGTLFPRVDPATGRNAGEWVAVGIIFNGVVIVYGLLGVSIGPLVRAHIDDSAASPASRLLALTSWAIVGAAPPVAYAVVCLLASLPA